MEEILGECLVKTGTPDSAFQQQNMVIQLLGTGQGQEPVWMLKGQQDQKTKQKDEERQEMTSTKT